jgi:hypothetical protein
MSTQDALEARILLAVGGCAEPDRLQADLDQFLPQCTLGVSSKIPTACIRRTGGRYRIEFGEAFLRDSLQDDRDLLFVLLHEAFHHVLGHLVGLPPWLRQPRMQDVANIAADILVNRAVCQRFFPGGVPLLARMYDRQNLFGALLRPPEASARQTMRTFLATLQAGGVSFSTAILAWDVYRAGWFQQTSFEALAILVRTLVVAAQCACDIPFLGDHRPDRDRLSDLPWGTNDDDDAFGPGHAEDLEEDETGDLVEPTVSPELATAVRQALVEDPNHPRRRMAFTSVTSPVFSPGRTDWPFLALGFWPTLFHGPRFDTADDDQRAHVYIDVSGSFDAYLSRVYGLILALGDEVGSTVHLFSNQVADATLDELARGLKRTTGGTDFDCVLGHALEHRYRRIVIITDGIGELEAGVGEAFQASGGSLYLMLLGSDEGMARLWSPLPEMAKGVWGIT